MQQNPKRQIGGLESKLKLIPDTVADGGSISGTLFQNLPELTINIKNFFDLSLGSYFSVYDTHLYPILGSST
jgi:hypothetical protein